MYEKLPLPASIKSLARPLLHDQLFASALSTKGENGALENANLKPALEQLRLPPDSSDRLGKLDPEQVPRSEVAVRFLHSLSALGVNPHIQLLALLTPINVLNGQPLPTDMESDGIKRREEYAIEFSRESQIAEDFNNPAAAARLLQEHRPELTPSVQSSIFLQALLDLPKHAIPFVLLDRSRDQLYWASAALLQEEFKQWVARAPFFRREPFLTNDFPPASPYPYHPHRTLLIPRPDGEMSPWFPAAGCQQIGDVLHLAARNEHLKVPKGYVEQFNPHTRGEKAWWIAASVMEKVSYWESVTAATVRSFGAIRPAYIEGKWRVIVTSRADIAPDPEQMKLPDSTHVRGRRNRYYQAFKELKDEYAAQGVALKVVTREHLTKINGEMSHSGDAPFLFLGASGYAEMRDHHRIWAILDNPDLGLAVEVKLTQHGSFN